MRTMNRREFLKSTPVAAVAVSRAAGAAPSADAQQAADFRSPHIGDAAYAPNLDYPIRPIRYADVTIADRFWKPKIDRNAAVTIPLEVAKLGETRRGLGGNVLEAAILSLRTHPNPSLQAIVDARVAELKREEWRGNSGFEVAAAWYHATGRRDLVDKAAAAAARLYDEFAATGPPFSGGERDAINCVELFRVTRDKKHLDLAKHYLDIRGLATSVNRSRHNQSYKPVLEQSEAVGHAVNCASLMVSLADVGVLTGLPEYLAVARRMWDDVVERKMYVTGGIGTTGNEGFGEPYSLPTIAAYSETCAVLMFMTLNHRLFLATGDAKYIDVLERGMYNNAVDGVSEGGDRFFYVNRLASAGDGRDLRWERASLECCPPNLVRFLAAMPGFVYAQDASDAVYVNLYVSSASTFRVREQRLGLSVESEMPWGGVSRLSISTAAPVRAAIKLRIPGWARGRPVPGTLYRYADAAARASVVEVNGAPVPAAPDRLGYVTIDREWSQGDVIRVEFPFDVRQLSADERVVHAGRRIAIERGPIVYCAEWPDVPGGRALDVWIDRAGRFTPAADARFASGVTAVKAEAASVSNPAARLQTIALIPYYLWANRGAGEMSVWLPISELEVGDIGPSGGFIFYKNPNWAADGWRYLEAAPFDQSAGAKWGCFRHAIAGARGTAIGTGRQNTIDIVRACTDGGVAAGLCASLDVSGIRGWFLPSRDEVALMYRNLKAAGIGAFHDAGFADNFTYWTSSQQTEDMANHVDFADSGRQHYDDKDFPRRVRAVRQI